MRLSNCLIQVLNEDVGILVELLLRVGSRHSDAKSEAIKQLIVHFSKATLSFSLVRELEIAVATSATWLVKDNLSILNFISS